MPASDDQPPVEEAATLDALVGALETILHGLVGPDQLAQLTRDIGRSMDPPDADH